MEYAEAIIIIKVNDKEYLQPVYHNSTNQIMIQHKNIWNKPTKPWLKLLLLQHMCPKDMYD
jgi:hypothetical protein